ncbi:MAG: hypothetical protein ACI9XO_005031, partial [Paraglaciecola sp.]
RVLGGCLASSFLDIQKLLFLQVHFYKRRHINYNI